ncbi:MAG TPA: DUF6152 family protein [Pelomicrobium sp.]|nr:DUF6152 family protein [Pelomicrobium sp.]
MRKTAAIAALLGVLAAPALAHHGWNEYDQDTPVTLQGRITKSGYEHPHGYVELEADGKVWLVVLAPPSRMKNRGLPPEDLTAGTSARVEGYRKRSDPAELRAERITVNGKTVELR